MLQVGDWMVTGGGPIAAMIAFYATSFDSIALVASSYTYKQMTGDEEPHRAVKFFWAVMLILFPIALVFSESSMANLQTVSIIAAFPVAPGDPSDHRQLLKGCGPVSGQQ